MKKLDIYILILFPVLAFSLSVLLNTSLLISIFLFFGLPSIYLSLRNHSLALKSFIFSFVLSLLSSLYLDVLATLDKSWVIPHSLFPFKFFGLATGEVYFFGLLWVFLAVLFYEYFLDRGKQRKMFDKRIKYLYFISSFLISVVIIAWFFNSIYILTIPYFYALCSLFFIAVLVIFLRSYPKFLHNFILVSVYFFFLAFLFEIAALHNTQWVFASKHYIGFIEVLGLKFPIEEFIFWMVFATPSLLAIYEFFADDRK